MTAPRKFRVWDPEAEEMHEPPHDFVRDGEGRVYRWAQVSGANYEVVSVEVDDMDYTGLDDAEGAPIYEGDLVESIYDVRYEVFWDSTWGRFDVERFEQGDGDWVHAIMAGVTVIGNRYENPDLLEASGADQKGDAEYGIQAIAKNLEQLWHGFRRIATDQ